MSNKTSDNVISILIFSDSTSLSRENFEEEDTWPFRLKILLDSSQLFERVTVTNESNYGVRVTEILDKVTNFRGLSSYSWIILGAGVVDSAPRPITWHFRILSKIPLVGGFIWDRISLILKRYRPFIQQIWSFQTTSRRQFRVAFSSCVKVLSKSSNVLVLQTPMPSDYVCRRSPGWAKSVNEYNSIKMDSLGNAAVWVPFEADQNVDYLSPEDGHHLSKIGHEKLAKMIFEFILAHEN